MKVFTHSAKFLLTSLYLVLFSLTSHGQNINEFHYDNSGGDVGEFVEIFFTNPQPTDLSLWRVDLYNGKSNNRKTYKNITLDQLTATVGTTGTYYVWDGISGGIQNGSPDGLSLSGPGFLEFLSYEGTFEAANGPAMGVMSTDVGVNEPNNTPIGQSLALDNNTGTWEVLVDDNPGSINYTPVVPTCSITAINISNISTCNDHGTSDPDDDTFTYDVTIEYVNPPSGGNLLIRLYDANGTQISAHPQSFDAAATSATYVGLLANVINIANTTITAEADFSMDATCSISNTNAGSAPSPCSTNCNISNIELFNISACNDSGTPADPSDDFFTYDVTVTFTNPPPSGQISVSIFSDTKGYTVATASYNPANTTHTFSGLTGDAVAGILNATATFTTDATCALTLNNVGMAPASCSGTTTCAINVGANIPCIGEDLNLFEVGGEATTWSWTGPNGFTSTEQFPVITATTAANIGDYIVEITAPGCTATATVAVGIKPLPIVDIPLDSKTLCDESGVYSIVGATPIGGTFSGPNTTATGDFDATAAGPGTYDVTYTYTDADRCDGTDIITITVTPLPTPGGYGFPCLNDLPIELNGGNPPGGTYTGMGVVNNTFDPGVAGVGTFTLTYTDANNCTATTEITVIQPPASPTAPAITQCEGMPTIITPSGGSAYNFYAVDPAVEISVPLATGVVTFDPGTTPMNSPQTIWVTSYDPNNPQCDSDPIQVVVTVNPNPVFTVASNSPVCTGSPIILTTTTTETNMNWAWTGPDAFASMEMSPTIEGAILDMAGTYSLIGTTTLGCKATQTTEVTVMPTPATPTATNIAGCDGIETIIVPSIPGGGGPGCLATDDLIITGIYDGPLNGGTPKGVEIYVINDIADLSLFGIGSATNGGGTDGEEFTFPADAVTAGTYIYVTNPQSVSNGTFMNFFGFAPTYSSNALAINGDDAIELFHEGVVIDVFGDINTDGTGEPWEYLDGWAARVSNTPQDGSNFNIANWTFSGKNVFDGETTNAGATPPFPIGTYSCVAGTTVFNFYDVDPTDGTATPVAADAATYDPGTTVATSPQTIWVTNTNANGCVSAPLVLTITVNPNPVFTVSSNTPVCEGADVLLTTNMPTPLTMTWAWTGPNAYTSMEMSPTITGATPAMSGIYSLLGTTEFGCVGTQTTQVSVIPTPAAPTIEPVAVCIGDAAVLNPGASIVCEATLDIIITGVFDGPLSGGLPKAIEFYAVNDIPDLSIYGFGSANNAGGTDGQEFTFPADVVAAGTYFWVASEGGPSFMNFFGFPPTYVHGAAAINGDDAIELFNNGTAIDVFGVVGTDGSGQPWEYLDGWAYRNANTGQSTTFDATQWTYSGKNALDGETSNAAANTPFPINTYTCGSPFQYNFYDADPTGTATLLTGPTDTYEVPTVPATIWVTAITPEGCESPATEVSITNFDPPTVFAAELTNCQNEGTDEATFTLEDATETITGGDATLTVTAFYESETDAMDEINPIVSPYISAATTLFATVINVNGCVAIAEITLTTFNCTAEITDPCTCVAPNSQAFTDNIVITAPAGQTWTVQSVSKLTFNGSPVQVGMQIAEGPAGTYAFVGMHPAGVGYTLTVVNENGITLSVANMCFYPTAVIEDFNTLDQFCANSPAITLKGNANGVDGTGTFTIDGNPVTVLDPSTLSFGQHTIVYSFDAGTATPYDETDPGCIDEASVVIEVIQTPTQMGCQDFHVFAFDENCQVVITPADILSGQYGCWDDYEVTLLNFAGIPLNTNIATGDMAGQTWSVQVTHLPSNSMCMANNITFVDGMAPVVDCGSPLPITEISGEITPGDPIWTRPFVNGAGVCNPSTVGIDVSYDTQTFSISQADTYTFSMPSIIGPDFFAALYLGDFDPTQPCVNLIATDDDSNGSEPEITISLTLAPGEYTLVTTTFAPNNTAGPYTYNLSSTNGGQLQSKPGEIFITCLDDVNVVTMPTATDNCDPEPYVNMISQTWLDTDMCDDGQKVLQRTWRATDHSGKQSDLCTQTIYITSPTSIDFPEDITWTCDQYAAHPEITEVAALHGNISDWDTGDVQDDIDVNPNMSDFVLSNTGSGLPGPVVSNDNSCNFNIEHSDQVFPHCGGAPGVLKIHRLWTITNICTGAITTHTQLIVVADIDAPEMDFTNLAAFSTDAQGNITLTVSANGIYPNTCNSVSFIPTPGFSDNCSGLDMPTMSITTPAGVVTGMTANGGYIPAPGLAVGVYTDGLTYQISDKCGNTAEVKVTLIVQDDVTPTMACDLHTTVSITNTGEGVLFAETVDDGTTDNCGVYNFDIKRMGTVLCNNTDTQYGEFVTFCCTDIGTSQVVQMRATDVYGNTSTCMVDVLVEDKLAPICLPPANATIGCNEFDIDNMGATFGSPVTSDNCAFTVTEDAYTGELNGCSVGTITRHWTVTEDNGNHLSTSCSQNIEVYLVQNYSVKFPNDLQLTACTSNPFDTIVPIFGDNDCEQGSWEVTDELITSVEGACYKILRTYEISDWCDTETMSYDPVVVNNPSTTFTGPTVHTNATNHGRFIYTQVIMVSDNDLPTVEVIEEEYCVNTEDCTLDELFLKAKAHDACSIDNIEFSYFLYLDNDGDGNYDEVIQDDDAGAPIILVTKNNDWAFAKIKLTNQPVGGTHKIKWTAEDNCGNFSDASFEYEVKDCKKPTIEATDATVNIMDGGMITLWPGNPANCLQSGLGEPNVCAWNPNGGDNCTADADLTILVQKATDSNAGNLPPMTATSLTFTCDEVGENIVEIWVGDASGNWDYITVITNIDDNNNKCPNGASVPISGAITMYDNDAVGVEGVTVELMDLTNNLPAASTTTPSSGVYGVSGLPNLNYEIKPSMDGTGAFAKNGVSVIDLLLIYQKILGGAPLTKYQQLAADVDGDGEVQPADLIIIRDLILGKLNAFPDVPAWRFYEKNCDINQGPCPEIIDIQSLSSEGINSADFVAIKMGDVSGDAAANMYSTVDDRTFGELILNANDRMLIPGEEVTITLQANREDIIAYQFTLNIGTMEFVDVTGRNVSIDNFGIHTDRNAITTSWTGKELNGEVFTIILRATEKIRLSEALHLTGEITPSMAFDTNKDKQEVKLAFDGKIVDQFTLFQNEPNPFSDRTQIMFYLPNATSATMTIYDASGRTLKTIKGDYPKGRSQVSISKSDLNASGVLYYKLETETDAAIKKMIIME